MKQKEIVESKIIPLTIKDVMEIMGWSESTTRRVFLEPDFPAIKKGKNYQVEADAFKEYLKVKRVND